VSSNTNYFGGVIVEWTVRVMLVVVIKAIRRYLHNIDDFSSFFDLFEAFQEAFGTLAYISKFV
jgi:hypothetical protein